jgi:hypothetical protein
MRSTRTRRGPRTTTRRDSPNSDPPERYTSNAVERSEQGAHLTAQSLDLSLSPSGSVPWPVCHGRCMHCRCMHCRCMHGRCAIDDACIGPSGRVRHGALLATAARHGASTARHGASTARHGDALTRALRRLALLLMREAISMQSVPDARPPPLATARPPPPVQQVA